VRRQPAIDHRRSEEMDSNDSKLLSERSQMLHQRKESFMRNQISDSSNPYIREMMRQDVENPIDVSDFEFIRKHPTAPLPTTTHLSAYQSRTPSAYLASRTPTSYSSKPSGISTSYSRPVSGSTYKPSSYLSPSSSTAAHILTKSHTLSPHSSHSTSAYTSSRQRPITSLSSDPSSRLTSSSYSRPHHSHTKSSASARDACTIS